MNSLTDKLCCGCLNYGRKMINIEFEYDIKCFSLILSEIPISHTNTILLLCYECAALLKKFSKFKQQIITSYKSFHDYELENFKYIEPEPRLHLKQLYNLSTLDSIINNYEIKIDIIKTELDEYIPLDDKELSDDEPLVKIKKKKKKNGIKKEQKESEYIEVVLNKEEIEHERKVLLTKEDYINAMFRCEKCIMSFPNADDLNDHVRMKHELHSSKHKCLICECSFSTEVSYNYHTNKHIRRYQCTVCSERFANKRAVMKHYNIVHCFATGVNYDFDKKIENGDINIDKNDEDTNSIQEQIFPCEFCGKTFKWRTSLRKHLETHRIETGEKRKPYCAPCRLSFTTTSNLQKHVRTSSKHQIQLKLRKLTEALPDLTITDKQKAHLEIRSTVNKSRHQFACTQCDKRFLWRGNLLRHLHSHAAKAKGDLVCKPCNKTFSSIATYQQHMKISKKHVSETDFKFMCSDCGKRFPTKSRLRDHINWEHLKNYVYSCDECHKVFKTSNSVYLHKQVHRKDTVQHLCDHCGKPFPNHAKLRSHILGVHGGAAHSCAICGARFAWHSCLSRHVRHKHKRNIRVHTF